jgi:hypothetical protein
MSFFYDPKYDYWNSHFLYIWSIKNVNLDNRLLSILDQRSASLLTISRHVSNNPNVEIPANEFNFLPASYDDLLAFTYIANNYLGDKVQMMNRSLIYIP